MRARRFERVLRIDAGARADVYFWEMRLGEMAPVVPAVTPPQSAWIGLRDQLERERAARTVVVRLPPPGDTCSASRAPAWRIVAGLPRRLRRSCWYRCSVSSNNRSSDPVGASRLARLVSRCPFAGSDPGDPRDRKMARSTSPCLKCPIRACNGWVSLSADQRCN